MNRFQLPREKEGKKGKKEGDVVTLLYYGAIETIRVESMNIDRLLQQINE